MRHCVEGKMMKTNLTVQYKVRQLLITKPFDSHGMMKFSFFSGILMATSRGGGGTRIKTYVIKLKPQHVSRKKFDTMFTLDYETAKARQKRHAVPTGVAGSLSTLFFYHVYADEKMVTLRRCPRATDRPFRSVVFGQAGRERLGPRRTAPGDAGPFWWRICVLNCP